MALEDDIAILFRAPLFGRLDREPLRLLAFAAETRNLRAGEVLFHKGDRSDGGYVVVRGAVTLEAHDGSPVFLAEPGALIGQTALFMRMPRPATAVARDPTALMRISPTLMRRVLEEFPRAAAILHGLLAADLSALAGDLERVRHRLLAIDERRAAA